MKLIVAIIQPDKLDEVHQALIDEEVFRITVSRCAGHGQQEDPELYRTQEVKPGLLPKVRIEIAVNEDFVERAIRAILKGAKHGTGEVGDGKIFVSPLERCLRIRTGEAGSGAI